MATSYLDEEGNHVPLLKNQAFRGNAIFSSKNAFDKLTLSRRDDIIALIYMLDYLIETRLSWCKFDEPITQ